MSRRGRHRFGRPVRDHCGCVSDDMAWLELCPAHAGEVDAVRKAWAADHARELVVSVSAASSEGAKIDTSP